MAESKPAARKPATRRAPRQVDQTKQATAQNKTAADAKLDNEPKDPQVQHASDTPTQPIDTNLDTQPKTDDAGVEEPDNDTELNERNANEPGTGVGDTPKDAYANSPEAQIEEDEDADVSTSQNDEGHRAAVSEHFQIAEGWRQSHDIVLVSVGRRNAIGMSGLTLTRSELDEFVKTVKAFAKLNPEK